MRRISILLLIMLFHSHPLAQQQPSYQGLWWNAPAASESGWGVNITHQGDIVFATWFTYDASGNGIWLVVPSASLSMETDPGDPYGYGPPMMTTSYSYSGALYRTTGPAFDAATFDPTQVRVDPVGFATFRFTDPEAGTFTYTLNGVTQSKSIMRQVFATPPACALGGSAAATPNYQDLWWRSPAASESGWGVNLTHQGDTIFATWFTYGANGEGIWFVLPSGTRTGSATYSGTLYRTTGPAFNTALWRADQVVVTEVGSATLSFSDADNGTFSYVVNGKSGSKSITRQVYSTPKTVCR